MLSPLGPGLLGAGVGLLVLGTVLAAPASRSGGTVLRPWWTVLAGASLVALAGAILDLVEPGLGRILVVPASVAAVVASASALRLPSGGRPWR